MSEFAYVGSELELFAAVRNWKTYWSHTILPYIAGDVLEVGAGIGANAPFLASPRAKRWVCLEPDPNLVNQLKEALERDGLAGSHEVLCGTLATIDSGERFDTILYIDVLEHIKEDREELARAAGRLRPGGRVIVLSPAHQSLFTPFDAAIGHFRRYNRPMMRSVSPAGAKLKRLIYLDCAGLLLSLGNRLLLRQSMPTKAQLHVWDKWVIPVSRVLDPCLFHQAGKTIVGIWQKDDA